MCRGPYLNQIDARDAYAFAVAAIRTRSRGLYDAALKVLRMLVDRREQRHQVG